MESHWRVKPKMWCLFMFSKHSSVLLSLLSIEQNIIFKAWGHFPWNLAIQEDPLEAVGSQKSSFGIKEGHLEIRSWTGGLRVQERRGYNKIFSCPKKKLLKSETLTDNIFIIPCFALPGDILALSSLEPRRTNCQWADWGIQLLACGQECLFLNSSASPCVVGIIP